MSAWLVAYQWMMNLILAIGFCTLAVLYGSLITEALNRIRKLEADLRKLNPGEQDEKCKRCQHPAHSDRICDAPIVDMVDDLVDVCCCTAGHN